MDRKNAFADRGYDDAISGSPRPQLAQILSVVRERWWLALLAVLLVAGAAGARSATQESEYQATALLAYTSNNSNRALSGNSLLPVTAYQSDFQRDKVARQTLQRLALTQSVREGAEREVGGVTESISAAVDEETNLIQLSAVATNPQRAAEVANAWAQSLISERARVNRASYDEAIDVVQRGIRQSEGDPQRQRKLEEQLQNLEVVGALQQSDVQLAERAVAPGGRISPRPFLAAGVGGAAGLLLALALIVGLNALDRRLKSFEDVEVAWNARMLTSIGPSSPSEVLRKSTPAVNEALSHLYAGIAMLPDRPRVIAVTSSIPGEGKSTVALGLGLTMAVAGRRTLVIDADFRRPTLTELLDAHDRPGLSTVINGDADPADALTTVSRVSGEGDRQNGTDRHVDFLGTGHQPWNPYEYLSSRKMADLIEQFRERWDYIVIDTAPLLPVSDTVPLLARVDGVLVAARLFHSRSDGARRAQDLVARAGGRVLGLALAGPGPESGYGYGYGYGYGQEYGASRRGVFEVSSTPD